jgi:hypothetical protein
MSTLAAANRRYFEYALSPSNNQSITQTKKSKSAISDSYDSKPWFAKVNNQVTDTLRSRLDWVGIPFANTESSADAKQVKLLDYACGTGLMTRVNSLLLYNKGPWLIKD